jgi:hypothetical protein
MLDEHREQIQHTFDSLESIALEDLKLRTLCGLGCLGADSHLRKLNRTDGLC